MSQELNELKLKSLTADAAIEEILKASAEAHENLLRYIARKGGDIRLLLARIEAQERTIAEMVKKIATLENPKE